PHQRCAMRMEFHGENDGLGTGLGEDAGLSSGGGAAIQDLLSPTQEQSNELRSFVLKHKPLLAEGPGTGDISVRHDVGVREELPRLEPDTLALELLNQCLIGADNSMRCLLVVCTDVCRGLSTVDRGPSLDDPIRMRFQGI